MWRRFHMHWYHALISFLLAHGTEFHKEHAAVHQIALWRRAPLGRAQLTDLREPSKMQVAISAHAQRIMNISTALEDQKTEYTGTIGVGTDSNGDAQFEARVVFDTGSTNLWVASVLCKEPPCDTDRAREFYDPGKSVTQEPYAGEDGEIDIMFGTGELKGPLHVDTYHVGPMKVRRQPFAMIREMEGDVFSSFPFEGILGLGFKSLSFGGINPFFERVIEQRLLTNNEFAFFFNVDSHKPSALLWGGIDKDLYHGSIRMFPVVQPHYWALELVDFKLGNTSMKNVGMSDEPMKRLIVDSGTTYFTAPEGLHEQIVAKIPENNCADVNDYPPLTYVLKGSDGETYELVVSQETYMIGSDSENCRPAFMALDVNEAYGPA
jgi:pepsin A